MSAQVHTEFVISIANEPGAMAEVAAGLGCAGVNITGLLVEGQGEFGVMRVLTSDPARTEEWLGRAGHRYRVHDVVSIGLPNRPGVLAEITQRLAASGINVEAAYASAPPGGEPTLTFAVDDLHSARKVLGA